MYHQTEDEELAFLKTLWSGKPAACPKCGAEMVSLHKKAKKSNDDWKCPACGEIYRTIRILQERLDRT